MVSVCVLVCVLLLLFMCCGVMGDINCCVVVDVGCVCVMLFGV